MSNKVLILLMLFSLALCLKTIEESEVFLKAGNPYAEYRTKIISALKTANSNIKYSYPDNYKSVVKNFDLSPGVEYIEDLAELNQINSGSYLLPDEIKSFFSRLPNSSIKTMHYLTSSFHYGNNNNFFEECQVNVYFVSALRMNDYVLFGIIHSNIKANLPELYSKVRRSTMERQWWCLWLCEIEKFWYENVRRNPSTSEQSKVKVALQAKSGELIKRKSNTLK